MAFLGKSTANETDDIGMSWVYAVCAANLYRFLPEINTARYGDIFSQLMSSRYRAADDQLSEDLPISAEVLTELSAYIKQIKDRPGIVATFHTGSYRLLNRVMCMQGLHVAIIMSSEIIAEQSDYLYAQHAKMENAGALQLIDADASNCLIKLLAALRNGFHVLVYIDGNHGSTAAKAEEDNEVVPFFSSNLLVRKGLAVISHKRNVPIYPILSSLDDAGDTVYKTYPTILPFGEETPQQYSTRAFRLLYTYLQEVISEKPELWEGWLYAHTMPVENEQHKKRSVRKSYWPCRVGTRYYMITSPQYTCREIGKLSFLCIQKWKRLTKQLKS